MPDGTASGHWSMKRRHGKIARILQTASHTGQNAAMVKTRQILLENFDEEVQDKLRVRAEDSRSARNRFERMLMDITRAELGDCASFDDDGFNLHRLPSPAGGRGGGGEGEPDADIPLGRYELPRRSGEAHLYRIHHPLAQWVTQQAKSRKLDSAKLMFDYDAYGTRVSTLEPYRGKAGWLTCKLLIVEALGNQEQHILVAATTTDGVVLAEDDPEKLLRLPATAQAAGLFSDEGNASLAADVESRRTQLLREIKSIDAEIEGGALHGSDVAHAARKTGAPEASA
ncbi:protein of unknown function [Methylococcus capsulatus]|uniref:Uncharacterized protein n=2 Tax=Methylococcus capsulatus TaxID=414 RepID=A0AA35UQ64_METCP|nr:protein of unknown function [Methylococcus capsulatus]